MLSDSRGVPIICILFVDFARFVIGETINNYWARLRKISWFVSGEQINYWYSRHSQVTIFRDNRVQSLFYHSFSKFVFIFKSLSDNSGKRSAMSVVSIAHEQNIICSQTHLNGTTHDQTIIYRQLFAGHVRRSRPMKKEMQRMIKLVAASYCFHYQLILFSLCYCTQTFLWLVT